MTLYFSGDPNWTQTFVNGSAVALLAFLFLLNLTQVLISIESQESLCYEVNLIVWVQEYTSPLKIFSSYCDNILDNTILDNNVTDHVLCSVTPGLGHSVFGITANSAIGLLGLLLFINILRVSVVTDFTFFLFLWHLDI